MIKGRVYFERTVKSYSLTQTYTVWIFIFIDRYFYFLPFFKDSTIFLSILIEALVDAIAYVLSDTKEEVLITSSLLSANL